MTYVRSDEDEADAVERVLARVEFIPSRSISCLPTADSTTSASSAALVIRPTVVHVPKKGERMKDKLETHKSYMTTYRMYKDSDSGTALPARGHISYQNGIEARQARRGRSWLRGVWRY